jgi:hypothetical protein
MTRSTSTTLKLLLALSAVLVITACPGEKKQARIPVDTTTLDTTVSTDLSQVTSNLPEAEPDTFKPRVLRPSGGTSTGGAAIPNAPGPLMDAVQREQSFTRFCFTEFGQKADPTLRGNVAMVVTVGSSGITGAKVGDAKWSGTSAGNAVNSCLNQRARDAWKLAPGAVKPGTYVVQLSFSGS